MNRKIFIACSIGVFMFVVSCKKDADIKPTPIIPVPSGMEYVEISSTKELINGDTKAYFVNDDIYWNGDDCVAVYDGITVGKNDFKVKEGEDVQYATLYGLVDIEWTALYCVAPAESVSDFDYSNETATVTIPSEQTISENVNVDRNAMISMSKVTRGSNNEPVATPFKNACSYLRFEFKESDVKEITVTSLNGETLAGTFKYKISGDDVSISGVTNGTPYITLKPSGTYFEKDKPYIIPVLSSASGFTGGFRFEFKRLDETSGATVDYFCPYPAPVIITRSCGISFGEITEHSGSVASAPDITIESNPVDKSSSSLSFCWSESDSGTSVINNHYNICLYSDEDCTNKIDGTELLNKSDVELGASAAGPVTYKWTNLNPSTTYYCRVQNSYNGKFSNVVSGTTDSN